MSLNIYDEYNILNMNLKNFNYKKYFKYEFTRIIDNFSKYINIQYIFRILYYVFNLDFYILLNKQEFIQYRDLNNLTDIQIRNLIYKFIKHYSNYYEKIIKKCIIKNLINNNKDLFFKKYTDNYIYNLIQKNTKDLINEIFTIFNKIHNVIFYSYVKVDKKYIEPENFENKIKETYKDELQYFSDKNLEINNKFICVNVFDEKYLNRIPDEDIYYKALLNNKS